MTAANLPKPWRERLSESDAAKLEQAAVFAMADDRRGAHLPYFRKLRIARTAIAGVIDHRPPPEAWGEEPLSSLYLAARSAAAAVWRPMAKAYEAEG